MMEELAFALEQRVAALEPPHLAQVACAYAAQSAPSPRVFRALMRAALGKHTPSAPPETPPKAYPMGGGAYHYTGPPQKVIDALTPKSSAGRSNSRKERKKKKKKGGLLQGGEKEHSDEESGSSSGEAGDSGEAFKDQL